MGDVHYRGTDFIPLALLSPLPQPTTKTTNHCRLLKNISSQMSPEIYILEQSGGYGQCCGINHTKGNHRSPSRSTPHKSPAADPHPSALASSAARVVSLINNRGQRERAMLPALLAGLAPRSQHCLPARPQRHKILSPTPSRRD